LLIDYEYAKQQRIRNYKLLDTHLNSNNLLKINLEKGTVPMVYPYLSQEKELKNKVFIPSYWNNVLEWCETNDLEYQLAKIF
jgi:hypothetical protein